MLKTVSNKVIQFTWESDITSPKPTIVNYSQLSKRQFDNYMESMTEEKRGRTVIKRGKWSESLFRIALRADEKSVLIYNAVINDVEIPEIKDIEQALEFLMNLPSEYANELETAIRGISSLTEQEAKN